MTVTVSDGDLTAEESFEITVQAVNDAPVITSTAPNTATEDIEYTYQVEVEDPDNRNPFTECVFPKLIASSTVLDNQAEVHRLR